MFYLGLGLGLTLVLSNYLPRLAQIWQSYNNILADSHFLLIIKFSKYVYMLTMHTFIEIYSLFVLCGKQTIKKKTTTISILMLSLFTGIQFVLYMNIL